ncbi:hypothetical protein NECAME_03533 [Necator americanus]|uniref:Uncharacterized protein n=1 Tax=Necator americanus TaxID=51031 RepID=W2T2C8_NECAM|nr:hypothetical protein NECAME_03533 [Necator americanus]ETN76160.1 hypothetical protein NECAME_03533 [Necator americanus]
MRDEEVHGNIFTVGNVIDMMADCLRHLMSVRMKSYSSSSFEHPSNETTSINICGMDRRLFMEKKKSGMGEIIECKLRQDN